MGKILQYLGVSEEGQNRDILDAERLLEGMQMIYSQSPDGSKKDSFSVPLAEMTKIFIEKVKGIEPTPIPEPEVEEELPFKEGDRFKIMIDPAIIYKIIKINDKTVEIGFINADGSIGNIDYGNKPLKIKEAKESFEKGEWVLVKDEELPFKEGDRFKIMINPTIIYTIVKIDDETIKLGFIDKDGSIYNIDKPATISYVKENFEKGEWVLIEDEELPFKVGDRYVKTYDKTDINTIEEINVSDDEVTTSYIDKVDGKIIVFYSLKLVKEKFEKGEWTLVKEEEFPFKEGDKFRVEDTSEKFTLFGINENDVNIGFYVGDGKIDIYNLTKEEFLENVSLGRYIKITDEEFSPKPQKPKRTRKPKEETEQEKQIREILEINLDDIDL